MENFEESFQAFLYRGGFDTPCVCEFWQRAQQKPPEVPATVSQAQQVYARQNKVKCKHGLTPFSCVFCNPPKHFEPYTND